jgi:hypothetical protein
MLTAAEQLAAVLAAGEQRDPAYLRQHAVT